MSVAWTTPRVIASYVRLLARVAAVIRALGGRPRGRWWWQRTLIFAVVAVPGWRTAPTNANLRSRFVPSSLCRSFARFGTW